MLAVTCVECYVKGTAHATLTVEKDFNISTALTQFIGEFGGEVVNITKQFWEEFEDWAAFVYKNATDTVLGDVVDAVSLQCTPIPSCLPVQVDQTIYELAESLSF